MTHPSERSPDGSHDDLKVYGQYLETVNLSKKSVLSESQGSKVSLCLNRLTSLTVCKHTHAHTVLILDSLTPTLIITLSWI